MAEGPSKAPSDVTPPSGEDEEEEKEVTLDFDEDTLTGELSAAFSSKGDFVIMFPVFQTINTLLDFFSLSILSFFLKFFRVTFIRVMALRKEKILKGRVCHFTMFSWKELPLHGGKLYKLLRSNYFILFFPLFF